VKRRLCSIGAVQCGTCLPSCAPLKYVKASCIENWDLNKALEFKEDTKAAPQSTKKVKKKKELTEGIGEKEEQKSNTLDKHSEDISTARPNVRANLDLFNDVCKRRSEAVGKLKDGVGSSSRCSKSETARYNPIVNYPRGLARDVEELEVEATVAFTESSVKEDCKLEVTKPVQVKSVLQLARTEKERDQGHKSDLQTLERELAEATEKNEKLVTRYTTLAQKLSEATDNKHRVEISLGDMQDNVTKAQEEGFVRGENLLPLDVQTRIKELTMDLNKTQRRHLEEFLYKVFTLGRKLDDEVFQTQIEELLRLNTTQERQLKVEQNKVVATEKALKSKERHVVSLRDEKKKLELKVEKMAESEKAKVAMQIQNLRSEKEELRRRFELQQNKTEAAEKLYISSFKSQAAAEKMLKNTECERLELKRQMKALDIEKTKMQIQLEGVKRKLSLEEKKGAAAKEELNSVAIQLALVNEQLKYEQSQRKAAEEELANNLKEEKSKMALKRVQKSKEEERQLQLDGIKESLSLEQITRAAAEKEVKRLTNQVESMNEQLIYEQDLRQSSEYELAELKCKQEEELSNFFRQMMGAGETFLRSRQQHQQAEQGAAGKARVHCKQGAHVNGHQASENIKSSSDHDRLVEKLLKQFKQSSISPADCSRFVQRLRASRGGLSGLPLEVIEEEVRRMAMEEVEEKAKECPICFDLMVSNLLQCKQCNQAFHWRCWNDWAQLNAAECPICRTSRQ